MLALVYDIDKESRQVLRTLLRRLGYTTVLAASSPAQFRHYLKDHPSRIRLIVFCSHQPEGFRFQLFSLIQQAREVDSAPMVMVPDELTFRSGPNTALGDDYARVDYILKRPYGVNNLRRAVEVAHVQRNTKRNVLVYFSVEKRPELLETIYENFESAHWRAVEWVSSVSQFKDVLRRQRYRVGSILADVKNLDAAARVGLARFKKTTLGVRTPVVCLGREPEILDNMRVNCDMYFDAKKIASQGSRAFWQNLLVSTSRRLLNKWSIREAAIEIRSELKCLDEAKAAIQIKNILKVTPEAWELHELLGLQHEKQGRIPQAIDSYQKSIEFNPCSPVPHLGLIRIYKDDTQNAAEFGRVLAQALMYCPQHPQIRQEFLKHGLNHVPVGGVDRFNSGITGLSV
jgi:DNA-binding response OmpR family regulator